VLHRCLKLFAANVTILGRTAQVQYLNALAALAASGNVGSLFLCARGIAVCGVEWRVPRKFVVIAILDPSVCPPVRGMVQCSCER
jgi:hypothetical protein